MFVYMPCMFARPFSRPRIGRARMLNRRRGSAHTQHSRAGNMGGRNDVHIVGACVRTEILTALDGFPASNLPYVRTEQNRAQSHSFCPSWTDYSTRAVMEARLATAINEGSGSFHLS